MDARGRELVVGDRAAAADHGSNDANTVDHVVADYDSESEENMSTASSTDTESSEDDVLLLETPPMRHWSRTRRNGLMRHEIPAPFRCVLRFSPGRMRPFLDSCEAVVSKGVWEQVRGRVAFEQLALPPQVECTRADASVPLVAAICATVTGNLPLLKALLEHNHEHGGKLFDATGLDHSLTLALIRVACSSVTPMCYFESHHDPRETEFLELLFDTPGYTVPRSFPRDPFFRNILVYSPHQGMMRGSMARKLFYRLSFVMFASSSTSFYWSARVFAILIKDAPLDLFNRQLKDAMESNLVAKSMNTEILMICISARRVTDPEDLKKILFAQREVDRIGVLTDAFCAGEAETCALMVGWGYCKASPYLLVEIMRAVERQECTGRKARGVLRHGDEKRKEKLSAHYIRDAFRGIFGSSLQDVIMKRAVQVLCTASLDPRVLFAVLESAPRIKDAFWDEPRSARFVGELNNIGATESCIRMLATQTRVFQKYGRRVLKKTVEYLPDKQFNQWVNPSALMPLRVKAVFSHASGLKKDDADAVIKTRNLLCEDISRQVSANARCLRRLASVLPRDAVLVVMEFMEGERLSFSLCDTTSAILDQAVAGKDSETRKRPWQAVQDPWDTAKRGKRTKLLA